MYSRILEAGIDTAEGSENSRLHRMAGETIVGVQGRYNDLSRAMGSTAAD